MKNVKRKYMLMRVYIIMEVDEEEKVDEIGRIVRDEVEELFMFGERDGDVLDFLDDRDVLKVGYDFGDMYCLDNSR